MTSIIFPKSVLAITDPLAVPNNKFGIHIHDENDLENAKNLVNTTEGDWGYVTFVITEKERDHGRWQKVFDEMRKKHLIPIVRIATSPLGNVWQKPVEAEINNWVGFLNSLNWVIENRYVVIFNEPNLAHEWGGKISPEEYARTLRLYSEKLKVASPDFFILPAGLAPEKNKIQFIKDMKKFDPEIFNYVDGWTSHPYPTDSISSYVKELKEVGKDLPIFITETGWSGKEYSEDEISDRLKQAYLTTWNNPKIVAVTPFILNYPNIPFAQFSWQKSDGSFYKFYNDVASLKKIKGQPKQIEKGEVLASVSQPIMLSGSDFVGAIFAKNTGQSIWSSDNTLLGGVEVKNVYMNELEPTKLGLIYFKAASVQLESGNFQKTVFLTNAKNEKISNEFSIQSHILNFGKIEIWPVIDKALNYLNL